MGLNRRKKMIFVIFILLMFFLDLSVAPPKKAEKPSGAVAASPPKSTRGHASHAHRDPDKKKRHKESRIVEEEPKDAKDTESKTSPTLTVDKGGEADTSSVTSTERRRKSGSPRPPSSKRVHGSSRSPTSGDKSRSHHSKKKHRKPKTTSEEERYREKFLKTRFLSNRNRDGIVSFDLIGNQIIARREERGLIKFFATLFGTQDRGKFLTNDEAKALREIARKERVKYKVYTPQVWLIWEEDTRLKQKAIDTEEMESALDSQEEWWEKREILTAIDHAIDKKAALAAQKEELEKEFEKVKGMAVADKDKELRIFFVGKMDEEKKKHDKELEVGRTEKEQIRKECDAKIAKLEADLTTLRAKNDSDKVAAQKREDEIRKEIETVRKDGETKLKDAEDKHKTAIQLAKEETIKSEREIAKQETLRIRAEGETALLRETTKAEKEAAERLKEAKAELEKLEKAIEKQTSADRLQQSKDAQAHVTKTLETNKQMFDQFTEKMAVSSKDYIDRLEQLHKDQIASERALEKKLTEEKKKELEEKNRQIEEQAAKFRAEIDKVKDVEKKLAKEEMDRLAKESSSKLAAKTEQIIELEVIIKRLKIDAKELQDSLTAKKNEAAGYKNKATGLEKENAGIKLQLNAANKRANGLEEALQKINADEMNDDIDPGDSASLISSFVAPHPPHLRVGQLRSEAGVPTQSRDATKQRGAASDGGYKEELDPAMLDALNSYYDSQRLNLKLDRDGDGAHLEHSTGEQVDKELDESKIDFVEITGEIVNEAARKMESICSKPGSTTSRSSSKRNGSGARDNASVASRVSTKSVPRTATRVPLPEGSDVSHASSTRTSSTTNTAAKSRGGKKIS